MNAIYPLTLLYDASCPVCGLEIDHLKQRCGDGRLLFVDITAPGFDAAAWGSTPAALACTPHPATPVALPARHLPASPRRRLT